MDVRKVSLGLLLLAVSSIILFAAGPPGTRIPLGAAAIAAVGMAVGALLVGTAVDDGRPV